jgi:predicted Fe-Mo cluster-binding NifX family protein
MKIAMPTDDRRELAAHFGRAAEFAVYETAEGEARVLEYRPNVHVHSGADHGPGAAHSHDFDEGLAGVDVLICRGMGPRAADACAAMGIRVVFADEDDLDAAAKKFARGELAEGEASCECGEGHAP